MPQKNTASSKAASTAKVTNDRPSAEELAQKVKRDGKTVRAFLRKNFSRSNEQKGGRWIITPAIEKAVVEHYAALDKKEAAAS